MAAAGVPGATPTTGAGLGRTTAGITEEPPRVSAGLARR